MDTLRLVLASALALIAVAALLQLVWGHLDIPSLEDVPGNAPEAGPLPAVSIIVAARDEERHIDAAVRSILAQNYPRLELIVVDDRSQDSTGEILDRLAATADRLRVEHVRELPDGWLGKNHALHAGAEIATGDLLLLADADVVLAPDAVARAVRLLEVEQADHLAVAPRLILPTWPLALVVNYFMMWFLLWLRPWSARKRDSSAFIGIGAFNLVRARAFRAVGGLAPIALRPDDDIMLGKLLKQNGYRQMMVAAQRAGHVEWYQNLGELARGFRKNAFAGLSYSRVLVAFAVVGNLTLGVWPFVAIWLTNGWELALYVVSAAAQMAAYAGVAFVQRTRPWLAVLYPLAAIGFVAIVIAAVSRTLRRRGIEWRGTFYPLDRLRANRL